MTNQLEELEAVFLDLSMKIIEEVRVRCPEWTVDEAWEEMRLSAPMGLVENKEFMEDVRKNYYKVWEMFS